MAEGITCMLLGNRLTFDLYLEISDRKETRFRDMIRGNVALLTGMLPLLNAIKAANMPQEIDTSAPFIMVWMVKLRRNLIFIYNEKISVEETHDVQSCTGILILILTWLNRPPVLFDLVPRPCLIAWLDHCRQRPLTLVSAPVGYGKSTLISSWLAHFMSKETRKVPMESEQ